MGDWRTPARDAAICTQYGRGDKLSDIASQYGLTKQRIEQIARKGGLSKRHRFPAVKPEPTMTLFGQQRYARRNLDVLEMHDAGKRPKAIADALGLSFGQVKGIIERYVPGHRKFRLYAAKRRGRTGA